MKLDKAVKILGGACRLWPDHYAGVMAIRTVLAEVERLRAEVLYEQERNAMNVKVLTEENERLRAATRYRNTHDVRASRIDAALALHHESQTDAVPPDTICFECDCLWPCPTVKALEGKA